jgi:Flp pilus assembly pilin Flp
MSFFVFTPIFLRGRSRASVTFEYILVSTFTAVVTIASLSYIGQIIEDKLKNLSDKLAESDELDWPEP